MVAESFGVLRSVGYSERAIFVIDKEEVIRYVDVHDISLQPDNEELFCVLAEIEPKGKVVVQPSAAGFVEPVADVVMYCTPWCPGCSKARAFLREHGIDFVEINVARDRAAASRLRQYTGGFETTPTFKVKGEIIVDWKKEKLAELLGI